MGEKRIGPGSLSGVLVSHKGLLTGSAGYRDVCSLTSAMQLTIVSILMPVHHSVDHFFCNDNRLPRNVIQCNADSDNPLQAAIQSLRQPR